jgi:hypothetical protein
MKGDALVATTATATQHDLQERLMMLAAASRSLLVSPRVEDVLPATLALAAEMVTADGYAVWQVHEGAWRVAASRGISETFAATTLVSLRRGVIVALTDIDVTTVSRRWKHRSPWRSAISRPRR